MTSSRAGSDGDEKGETSPAVQAVPNGEQLVVSDAVAVKRLIRKTDLLMMPGLGKFQTIYRERAGFRISL